MRRHLVFALTSALLLTLGAPTATSSIQASARAPLQATLTAKVQPQWQWPTDPPRILARPYLAPATPYGSGHRGIDISTATTTIYAPTNGLVHFAGVVVDRPVLSITQAGGLLTSFEPVTTSLVAGDVVHRGQVIGELQSGHCSVLCLHFGVRLDGEYVSPLTYLGGIPRSVLLPTRN